MARCLDDNDSNDQITDDKAFMLQENMNYVVSQANKKLIGVSVVIPVPHWPLKRSAVSWLLGTTGTKSGKQVNLPQILAHEQWTWSLMDCANTNVLSHTLDDGGTSFSKSNSETASVECSQDLGFYVTPEIGKTNSHVYKV